MDLRLADKVVLVSGGGRGIGAAIVQALAAEQAVPVIVERDAGLVERGMIALAAIGAKGLGVVADLTHPATAASAVAQTLERFGRIDGLVNNAGRNDGVGLTHPDPEAFAQSIADNVGHYYALARATRAELIARRGAIVNIVSKVAETGQGGTSGYAAANGARFALTREWAVELAPHEVRVNAVVVAECWTPMYAEWLAGRPDPDAARRAVEARVPLGRRMTSAEEIAAAVVWLLSPVAGHVTGQWLHVDGGYTHLDRAFGQHPS